MYDSTLHTCTEIDKRNILISKKFDDFESHAYWILFANITRSVRNRHHSSDLKTISHKLYETTEREKKKESDDMVRGKV